MMTDQQKIIIDEELKKIGAKLDNYDDFIVLSNILLCNFLAICGYSEIFKA